MVSTSSMTTAENHPFAALGLGEQLLLAVQDAGYAAPTPVQAAVIPAVLAGRDVLARAATGSGKTAAFGLPLVQRLLADPPARSARGNRVAVLVLAPTRELVVQISEVLLGFVKAVQTRLRVVAAFGGVSINPQMLALRGGVDVLIATPGRLLDLQRQNAVELSGRSRPHAELGFPRRARPDTFVLAPASSKLTVLGDPAI
jgi:ATP-dependent RNA helicase RhlE